MCGFVGLIGVEPAAPALLLGLQAIQHRGQDAAGLGTWNGGGLHLVKDRGLISQALPPEVLPRLKGSAGIAHVRYPTAGKEATRDDAQPFQTRRPGLLLAHNGNVVNVPELKADLKEQGLQVLSECDAEPLMLVLAHELTSIRPSGHTAQDVAAAVKGVFQRVRGAYTVVALVEVDGEPTLVAFRDPYGIRPGVYGTRSDGAWMAASESVALDVLGFTKTGDIPRGEVLLMRPGTEPRRLSVGPREARHCVFERIYFARADSQMEDGRVNRTRWRLGRALAREWKARGHSADVVVAIPDTSRPAAMAISEELGIRGREGFIKNRYSGRTFIMPDQATRMAALRLKLNPIPEMFHKRDVLLIDDSIVRGNTMRRIVGLVRSLGPHKVHVGIFSPPVRHACFYGIDMPTEEELIASHYEQQRVEEELARYFGADSVTFLSLEAMREVTSDDICDACFTGRYAVPVSDEERRSINRDRRG